MTAALYISPQKKLQETLPNHAGICDFQITAFELNWTREKEKKLGNAPLALHSPEKKGMEYYKWSQKVAKWRYRKEGEDYNGDNREEKV